ncbi:type VII secretion protein EccB [Gordonia amicalis]|uniref:type VII secretion protein EccB n=1 Tax=Gordonia amicalis TaxID=89053 RepID=UPI001EE06F13|nr:type VII secretion protein EccB [Gordonia amicalis]MDV7100284.1 type VII secretion protein EccB [Gordonia amicalis]UKO91233.1 type VII secretion protein EccB [Gordonia amicalis]
MARQLTTKAQVNGYRFLIKRLEHALVRRDVRMLHDPMRSQLQALVVGTILGLLVLGGCGVYGLVRPQGSVGDATIIVSKNSGSTHVLVEDTLHPVLNLASARLITGSSEKPTSVADTKLKSYPRGPLLGIPGAPASLPGSAHKGTSMWTVCDSSTVASDSSSESIRQTVIGEKPALGSSTVETARPADAVLVRAGDDTFLVYQLFRDGAWSPVRAEVDTGSAPVMRGLGLDGVTPRRMTPGLLNSFPLVDPLTLPAIPGAGQPGAVDSATVGSVVKSVGVDDETTFHVVLRGGVQEISAPTAEILRLADRDGAAPVRTVAPGELATLKVVEELPIGDFPQADPSLLGLAADPTLCRSWSRETDEPRAETALLAGRALPLASDAVPVRLTSADGAGPGLDEVYLPPGSGEYLQVTGNEADSARTESMFYVNDSGVRFGIPDLETGGILGLGDSPARAPWSVVSLLAPGPTLSREAALVAHDGLKTAEIAPAGG